LVENNKNTPKAPPPMKKGSNNSFVTYSVKIHQNGQPLPFPDKMNALWRLALGLPSLQ
jgi:maltose-binding protein MalE